MIGLRPPRRRVGVQRTRDEVAGPGRVGVPEPLECVELGDLLARHAEAGIELRIVPALTPLWERVVASTLEFSGIRLRNL